MESQVSRSVITVVGKDNKGVVAKVSSLASKLNINIEDITQKLLQDMFCMIMLVDVSECSVPQNELVEEFTKLGRDMAMEIHVTRFEVFEAMHKI